MKKIGLLTQTLAMACGLLVSTAHAERWDFTFHNLHHVYEDLANGGINTDYGLVSLKGQLFAEDANHDGYIDAAEVQVLTLGGYGFSGSEISSFSFAGNSFQVSAQGFRTSLSSFTGLFYSSGGYNDNFFAGSTSYISVDAAPVPEPASYGLLLTGLAGLIGLVGARRARTQLLP